jgi:hypothetical protein
MCANWSATQFVAMSDGIWRTLGSRAPFKSLVALPELHQGALCCRGAFGVDWDGRGRRSERLRFEVAGVPGKLI